MTPSRRRRPRPVSSRPRSPAGAGEHQPPVHRIAVVENGVRGEVGDGRAGQRRLVRASVACSCLSTSECRRS